MLSVTVTTKDLLIFDCVVPEPRSREDGVFSFFWALEESPSIRSYIVTMGGVRINSSEFGWSLRKWRARLS